MGGEDTVLIAGPTASGKSALAIDLAKRLNGIVINTDSMQVYDRLRIITARPNDAEMAEAPHHLYGHIDPSTHYSVGHWLSEVSTLLADPELVERPKIFVGGTGLYFVALLGGLAPIPEPDLMVRAQYRAMLSEEGSEPLWALLSEEDPDEADRLRPSDGQRIVRALEVIKTTGKPLSYWQRQPGKPLVQPRKGHQIWLNPDRDALRARIGLRFRNMLEEGAIEEVRDFLALEISPERPATKAIGVPEIASFLANEMSLDDAAERATIASSQYAKRQRTFFRGQFDENWRVYSGAADAII